MSLIQLKTAKETETGKRYWRSLNELSGTPEFKQWVEREFGSEGAGELDSNSRRNVLKLMAASFGLAGLTACRRPIEKILPAAKGIENYIPGKAYHYTTVNQLGRGTFGYLVEVHDGRPTKIEGNPDHPGTMGAATAFDQASLLSLYDPDRSKGVLADGKASDFAKFEEAWKQQSFGDGAGLRIVSQAIASPSVEALRTSILQRLPKAKWVEWEPVNHDTSRGGAQIAFGEALYPLPAFDKAKVVVALDYDFLGIDAHSAGVVKRFSKNRHISAEQEEMNRLYAVESQFSITGASADHRLRLRSADVLGFANDLAVELNALPGGLRVLNNATDRRGKFIQALAKDLKAAGAEALVVAGPRQPAAVHALAYAINSALGSIGTTLTFAKTTAPSDTVAQLKALSSEMASGAVKHLLILGGNPAYTAPADLQFEANLKKVPFSVHLGLEQDETAMAAKWHIPQAHYLESWGDLKSPEGTVAIQQPMIEPLYGGKTIAEFLNLLAGNPQKSYDIVRNYWTGQWQGDAKEANWKKALVQGVAVAGAPGTAPKADGAKVAAAVTEAKKTSTDGMEVTFHASWAAFDGRFANNGWLQECPEPMTKLTWDNAALVSAATAKQLGVSSGDMITISKGGYKVDAPVMIQPGQADNSIAVALGYGRKQVGRVGSGVGFNAYAIRTSDGHGFGTGYSATKSAAAATLVTTQEHHSMEGRPLVREQTLAEFKHDPEHVQHAVHHPPLEAIYPEHRYDQGYQWGMAIDLTSCIGCNACTVACQAENNIPIVGKDQVRRGREMHWIRIDRYFVSPEGANEPTSPGQDTFTDEPEAVFQPMTCQHCENAPCENVCPVNATVHSPEGLNDMAYNRCVGTRYCANNCPYKVRRFNFLNWHRDIEEVTKMVHNPDVTVRMRGVMEKCTYCVQRIQETKIKAKSEGRREIKDGEIVTACQQTCPADAIVFGNLNDPESRVSKLKKQERNYAVLAELNVKPRTSYLAKIRNVNGELS
jgi:molybdopterin-containing oxidoreductase family iron-sulfur binding subunit